MRKSYFPSTDAKLCGWALHLTTRLSADYAHFGLTLQQVEDLSERAESFRAAVVAAGSLVMRSQLLVARRNFARESFKDAARRVVGIIRAQVDVGDDEKAALGLTIPSPRRRETSRPVQAPNVIVHAVRGRSVQLCLMDAETGARRKPQDVRSALIFLAVGGSGRASATAPRRPPPGPRSFLPYPPRRRLITLLPPLTQEQPTC